MDLAEGWDDAGNLLTKHPVATLLIMTFLGAQDFIPLLKDSRWPVIVQISRFQGTSRTIIDDGNR